MGAIPVEGPTTTTGLQVVETLHAYGAFGLEPTVLQSQMITIGGEDGSDTAPFGAEVGRCQAQDCDTENHPDDPEILTYGQEYDAYDRWYFVRTTASSYDSNGDIKDELYQWLWRQFCPVIPECSGSQAPEIVVYQGVMQHPDASKIVNFDGDRGADPDEVYGTLNYCTGSCYDMDVSWSASGYTGSDPWDGDVMTLNDYAPVSLTGYDIDYDVGASAGQFMISQTAEQVAAFQALDASEQAGVWAAYEQFYYSYFNWFGASAALGDGYGLDYTAADIVQTHYIPQPQEAGADAGMTVTFADYPPAGWIGYCTVANCDGQTPSGIVTGYAYNADYYYFVFYATSDALDGDGEPIEAVDTWIVTYFTWLVPAEPELPDNTAIAAVLEAIGAASAELTVTLLW